MPKVIIIGAGAAGLGVAKELSKENGFEIIIVEALDRIGGRVKTVDLKFSSGQKADLGASWLHETRINPFFKIALENNWNVEYNDVNLQYGNEHGIFPQNSGVLQIVNDVQAQMEECVLMEDSDKTDKMSVKKFTESKIAEMVLVSSNQKEMALSACREVEHFVGMPSNEIPLSDGILSHANGRDAIVLNGYSQVIDWLWEGLESKVDLRLNEEAVEIDDLGGKFALKTNKERYEADYIVCTIPIGALKRVHGTLFGKLDIPDISKAINQTNMASLGKIIIEFPHVFWNEDLDALFVTNGDDCATVVTPFRGVPALMVLTGPPLTQIVEKNPETAFERIKFAFKHLTDDLPEPTNVMVTDWTQNKYFMGSYSARSLGQSYNDLVDAFIDGFGNLRFAGEHTILEGNGCVHAAYNSGLREAEWIRMNSKR